MYQNHFHMLQCHNCIRLSLKHTCGFMLWQQKTPPQFWCQPPLESFPHQSFPYKKHITHHILRHPAGKHWTPTTIHGNRMTWWNKLQLLAPLPLPRLGMGVSSKHLTFQSAAPPRFYPYTPFWCQPSLESFPRTCHFHISHHVTIPGTTTHERSHVHFPDWAFLDILGVPVKNN